MSRINGSITLDDVSKCLCILQEFLTDNPNWTMGVDYTQFPKVKMFVRQKTDFEKSIKILKTKDVTEWKGRWRESAELLCKWKANTESEDT